MNKYLLVLSVFGMGVTSISSAVETTTIKRSTSPAALYSNNSSVDSNREAELASLTSIVKSENFDNIKRQAEQGDAIAQSKMGVMYMDGKDYLKADHWFQRAVNQGYAPAQNNLAGIYYYGYGVEQDLNRALELFKVSAQQGYTPAQTNLEAAQSQKDVIQKINQDYANARTRLGFKYYIGQDAEKDYRKAAELFLEAADNGSLEAKSMLGIMYYKGQGITKDYHKAAEWFSKAAEGEDVEAKFYLGQMYREGQGVRQDYSKASQLFSTAAYRGNVNAQLALGEMYAKGEGVYKSNIVAKEWFGKACDHGSQSGCDAYRHLNQSSSTLYNPNIIKPINDSYLSYP